jgi:hypothetical protein
LRAAARVTGWCAVRGRRSPQAVACGSLGTQGGCSKGAAHAAGVGHRVVCVRGLSVARGGQGHRVGCSKGAALAASCRLRLAWDTERGAARERVSQGGVQYGIGALAESYRFRLRLAWVKVCDAARERVSQGGVQCGNGARRKLSLAARLG